MGPVWVLCILGKEGRAETGPGQGIFIAVFQIHENSQAVNMGGVYE